ncbi:MAG: site-specific DNA-methyltransferase [Gammaproteobacteria bacterium]|nr:site-specific DNA-methyltransferase [Gammaproteobacteria bacterium]
MRADTAAHQAKFDRLRALLREMFQLDRGDLDFGLYRVMSVMANEISEFLDDQLLPQIQDQLNIAAGGERAELERELQTARKQAKAAGYDPDAHPSADIVELNRRLAEMNKDAEAEADVYNHLANFFARYYTEGDFMSLRRYSGGGRSTYLIPYDGEEVKLHWANSDQYYIKTTENYASYVFKVGSGDAAKRVRFEISAADNEKDNVKEAAGKRRQFVLTKGRNAVVVKDGELVARFDHRPLTDAEKKRWPGSGAKQQARINETSTQRILAAADPDWSLFLATPAPTDADRERTLLAKHVERYTAKNSFDYFIHKDLSGFLRRELDLYLNTEVLHLDDLATGDAPRLDRALARVRVIRSIGRKIIDFLAQLEDFQKQLWLKKKFVLETWWCVTLDRVPEALYPEIVANAAQCEEWVQLFATNEITGDLANGNAAWTSSPSVDFLKANHYLVLDTRHFDRDFTDRLLAALSDRGSLDEQLDGLLIHGENFQALNLLQARYRGQIACFYIDPPYNAQSSEILYKNTYRDSSWLSLIENRLTQARLLESEQAVVVIAIDEVEQEYLGCLLGSVFSDLAKTCVTVIHNATGQQGNNFSSTHEYAYFLYHNDLRSIGLWKRENRPDVRPLRNVSKGAHLRSDAANCFYPIFVANGEIIGFGDVCPDDFHPRSVNVVREDGTVEVYPIDPSGIERKWVFARHSVEKIRDELFAKQNSETGAWDIIRRKAKFNYRTVWTDKRYSANSWGSRVLNQMMGRQDFTFPKSIHTVRDCIDAALNNNTFGTIIDYFAGSGTTGHAVINLNREDSGSRKFILAEMGQYFDTVLLPRLKKAIYSSEWKDGKPIKRDGISQLLKCIRLESYEDTLDSLEAKPKSDNQLRLLNDNPELAEDYHLRYALGRETARSASLLGRELRDPFGYSLSVVRDGVRRQEPVDLPETFNYLIGLREESRRRIEGALAIAGKDAEGRNCLIIWRNLGEMDHAALDAWSDRNRALFADSLNVVYVNGDHTLNATKRPEDAWTSITIDTVLREMMFKDR